MQWVFGRETMGIIIQGGDQQIDEKKEKRSRKYYL